MAGLEDADPTKLGGALGAALLAILTGLGILRRSKRKPVDSLSLIPLRERPRTITHGEWHDLSNLRNTLALLTSHVDNVQKDLAGAIGRLSADLDELEGSLNKHLLDTGKGYEALGRVEGGLESIKLRVLELDDRLEEEHKRLSTHMIDSGHLHEALKDLIAGVRERVLKLEVEVGGMERRKRERD